MPEFEPTTSQIEENYKYRYKVAERNQIDFQAAEGCCSLNFKLDGFKFKDLKEVSDKFSGNGQKFLRAGFLNVYGEDSPPTSAHPILLPATELKENLICARECKKPMYIR